MNNIQPTCWQRFKATFCCCCSKRKTIRSYDSPARVEETIRNVAENSFSKSVVVEVKHHHALKSTDMVTVLECLQQDNQDKINEHRRIIYDKNNDSKEKT